LTAIALTIGETIILCIMKVKFP